MSKSSTHHPTRTRPFQTPLAYPFHSPVYIRYCYPGLAPRRNIALSRKSPRLSRNWSPFLLNIRIPPRAPATLWFQLKGHRRSFTDNPSISTLLSSFSHSVYVRVTPGAASAAGRLPALGSYTATDVGGVSYHSQSPPPLSGVGVERSGFHSSIVAYLLSFSLSLSLSYLVFIVYFSLSPPVCLLRLLRRRLWASRFSFFS